MCATTLRRPWATPVAPGLKTLENRSSPALDRLGGMNHRHSCRQADDGGGGWPSRRADDAGTHIQTFIVYPEWAPGPSGSSAAVPRRTLTTVLRRRIITNRD